MRLIYLSKLNQNSWNFPGWTGTQNPKNSSKSEIHKIQQSFVTSVSIHTIFFLYQSQNLQNVTSKSSDLSPSEFFSTDEMQTLQFLRGERKVSKRLKSDKLNLRILQDKIHVLLKLPGKCLGGEIFIS